MRAKSEGKERDETMRVRRKGTMRENETRREEAKGREEREREREREVGQEM